MGEWFKDINTEERRFKSCQTSRYTKKGAPEVMRIAQSKQLLKHCMGQYVTNLLAKKIKNEFLKPLFET